jgi:hypothetical protein
VLRPVTPDRRSVLLAAALVTGVAGAGCSAGGLGPKQPPAAHPSPTKTSKTPSADPALRARAVAQQQHLLAASAGPAGQEPFASVRTLHTEHLQRLTGSPAKQPPVAPHPPVAATLATAEHAAAVQLRADCLQASPELAPLLASLAASSEVAALLLAP